MAASIGCAPKRSHLAFRDGTSSVVLGGTLARGAPYLVFSETSVLSSAEAFFTSLYTTLRSTTLVVDGAVISTMATITRASARSASSNGSRRPLRRRGREGAYRAASATGAF